MEIKTEALAEPRPLEEYHIVSVCLRTSVQVIEDDQQIGESNDSATDQHRRGGYGCRFIHQEQIPSLYRDVSQASIPMVGRSMIPNFPS